MSVVVAPNETEACIKTILSDKRFPKTRNETQQPVVYILTPEKEEK